jgi:hypothetical protein
MCRYIGRRVTRTHGNAFAQHLVQRKLSDDQDWTQFGRGKSADRREQ